MAKNIFIFILGMLAFAAGYLLVRFTLLLERPVPGGIITDWAQICFQPEADGLDVSITPRGCFSSTCTQTKQQVGTAVVDLQEREIRLEARFVLQERSRFPLPCSEDCAGGGTVQIRLEQLIPDDYAVWFGGERAGELMVFSGRPTPRQCFENTPE